jgi:hypothetical protein
VTTATRPASGGPVGGGMAGGGPVGGGMVSGMTSTGLFRRISEALCAALLDDTITNQTTGR